MPKYLHIKNQQLQILPVGNEFSDQKGAIVSYRITFNSKAVQGAKVINDLVNDPDQEPIISNDDGLVTLPLRNQGLNVVAAIYDEKSTNRDRSGFKQNIPGLERFYLSRFARVQRVRHEPLAG